MFASLFAESGLSLDRLKSLLEVGAAGSIVKAAGGDPVRQSQYSRQIKELEDFFRVRLIERHGKGTRLTANGKELARISRFFLLGLSNFQRGCVTTEQTFRIAGSATFIRHYLLPVVSRPNVVRGNCRYAAEIAADDEIERRLHDLTLDFGIITSENISRPLQVRAIGSAQLDLWVPKTLCSTKAAAERAFKERQLPLVLASKELDLTSHPGLKGFPVPIICDDFLQAQGCLEEGGVAAILPQFLAPGSSRFWQLPAAGQQLPTFRWHLAWNPRLLRLNPHAIRQRDFLVKTLAEKLRCR
jgi:DNA-binding transcriptional LysR family regulator